MSTITIEEGYVQNKKDDSLFVFATPIIKIVGNACNLRCDYCFYSQKDQKIINRMSDELLESFIKQFLSCLNGKVRFVWHGGEPLLAGLEYFKQIMSLQDKHKEASHEIYNTIQTNGTLINEKWANFFKEHNYYVGVSLDGPKALHDKYRHDANGNGSFDRVIKGLQHLKNAGVSYGLLQTANKDNILNGEANFRFYADEIGCSNIGICAYRYISNSPDHMRNNVVDETELAGYYVSAFDYWLSKGDDKLRIRQVDEYLSGIFEKMGGVCSFNGSCMAFITVDCDGKVYPCDSLANDGKNIIGDLNKEPLLNILSGDKREALLNKLKKHTMNCDKCRWYNACKSGCPAYYTKDGKYKYCKTNKMLFEVAEKIVNKTNVSIASKNQ